MRFNKINNVLNIGKEIIKGHVKLGDIVLDCTVGNGKDTLLLAKLVGPSGKVYGFDIQEKAIDNTKKLLNEMNIDAEVELILDSHEYIDKYVHSNVNLIVYNLGYLPGGDKSIITKANTSLESIKTSLNLLNSNGLLIVTVYPGHSGGMEEKLALEDLFSNLNQKKFNVLKYEFINQINNPPIMYVIEKSKEV